MIVVPRNEMRRTRVLCVLTIILAIGVLAGVSFTYSGRSEIAQLALVLLATAGVIALGLAGIQLFSYPRRSQALIFHRGDSIVVATNALHEGFKLRFLRDVLGDNVSSFSDEERLGWKALEADGYHAALSIRNVRTVVVLRLCTMIFDDVFVTDQYGRWDHHDCSSTSEPTFSKRENPPLKQGTDYSATGPRNSA